ncbi:hypothetical protein SAMN06298216_2771 [Spirosomataceae bacterium TFI 002]|nr:hypothetical protein SAMN06298216_2771 [Spirosomataceae bacterium TFI 002]
MKNLLFTFFLITSVSSFAQDIHNECVAVFNGENMIVDEFSPRGKSEISQKSSGSLTVNLVELGDEVKKGNAVSFYIAIKDAKTQTLTMSTNNAAKSFDLSSIQKRTKIGDKIVILLSDEKFALPTEQHEILIIE